MNEQVICPLCGEVCHVQNNTAFCSGHFSLEGPSLASMTNKLAYCWENIPVEDLFHCQTEIRWDDLTYIMQVKGLWKIEAEGKLQDIIGLFGAFKELLNE